MIDRISTAQIAQALGVSEATVKRWCDKGLIHAEKTAGGHRRVSPAELARFIRKDNRQLVRPEILSLPNLKSAAANTLEKSQTVLYDALIAGDESTLRQVLFGLYLANHNLAEIGDALVQPVFHKIGKQWDCQAVDVFQERRACQVTTNVLAELRQILPKTNANAPKALGGSIGGDHYQIPLALVDMVLIESGMHSVALGGNLPIDTLVNALEQENPALFWLSFSRWPEDEKVRRQYSEFFDLATKQGVPVVVGGQALSEEQRSKLPYSVFCSNLADLARFVSTVVLKDHVK